MKDQVVKVRLYVIVLSEVGCVCSFIAVSNGAAAMDKSAGFAAATAQLARQVVIVHDKFHVAEMFNKAVDSVRHKELAKAKRRATQGVTPALAL